MTIFIHTSMVTASLHTYSNVPLRMRVASANCVRKARRQINPGPFRFILRERLSYFLGSAIPRLFLKEGPVSHAGYCHVVKMANLIQFEDDKTTTAAAKEHYMAVTRDYISQPRISMCKQHQPLAQMRSIDTKYHSLPLPFQHIGLYQV